MRITNATPTVEPRTAQAIQAKESVPRVRPYRPAPARRILLSCTHFAFDTEEIRALGVLKRLGIARGVWCGTCDDWRAITNDKPTAADIVGIQVLPLPENPPF